MDSSYILSTINPVVGTLFSLTFFLIWRQQPHKMHIANWALAFFIGSLGFTFEFLNYFNPVFKLTDGVNIFVPVCVLLVTRGLCLRYTGQAPTRLLILILVVADLIACWINFVHQNAFGRGLSISIGIAVLLMFGMQAILKARTRDRIDLGILAAIAAAAILVAGRPILSFFVEGAPQIGAIEQTSFWAVSIKAAGLFSLLVLAILFMLRIAADLFAELNQQSVTDSLSGLLNRRGFFAAAEPLARQATPARPVSVLLLDIDHFKDVNDGYGHRAGDQVIQAIAGLMQLSTPEHALVGRLGGEEFGIFLPNTRSAAALAFAEALRASIDLQSHADIPSTHPITVSIGLAEGTGEELDLLLHMADIGLYEAKDNGRDQVRMAGRAMAERNTRHRPAKPA
ncbi:GGDEF domain-containing protein [Hoeflea ulvae]|uniref:diguanylate cyclase n=1 Tax=Hoeflea ulvae TaxID=2983764 RepID=A0ABT3YC68_9HYPH|nr:GGDEF domain-containing protein [Hoeflea ulvae]MCY0093402.1 GGDEF domain-containing protein [Hoeflea ulvae]